MAPDDEEDQLEKLCASGWEVAAGGDDGRVDCFESGYEVLGEIRSLMEEINQELEQPVDLKRLSKIIGGKIESDANDARLEYLLWALDDVQVFDREWDGGFPGMSGLYRYVLVREEKKERVAAVLRGRGRGATATTQPRWRRDG